MSFAARARSARAANDTTRAQINNIPSKSHVIPLLLLINLIEPGMGGYSYGIHAFFNLRVQKKMFRKSSLLCLT